MAFIEQSRFHVSGNFASNEKKKKKNSSGGKNLLLRWRYRDEKLSESYYNSTV